MNESVQKVIAVLQEQGLSDDEIAALCEDVMFHAYEDFIDEAKMLLTEEDLQRVEKFPEGSEASEIMRVYQERTGNDPQERLQHFIKIRSELLIQEYTSPEGELESESNSTSH